MFRWLLSAALVVSLSFLCASASHASDAEVKEAIKAQNEKYTKALKEKNKALFMEILAEDYVSISGDGEKFDRAQAIKDAIDPEYRLDEAKLDEMDIRVVSENAVVETSKWTGTGMWKNQPYHNSYRYTNVWVKRDGRWQLVSEQETLVKDTKKDEAAAMEEIKKIEGEFDEALNKNDASPFERYMVEDSKIVNTNGTAGDKASLVKTLKAGDMIMESWVTSDMDVRVYGDTALATFKSIQKSSYKGKAGSEKAVWTDVFAKRDGHWMLVGMRGVKDAADEKEKGSFKEEK